MINKKLYEPNEMNFFSESEELDQDLEDWEIVKKIQKEYSDYEGLKDGVDELIERFFDELFN